ncbi:signal peptidase II [Aliiroseovarius subalbicans]|uniref:signal peptidase II n=1 Tax=Aliiroseovarius subalbicans TaxID=2925840 RepID=UPI001F59196A|nr:signal peptidase II [Aliiroseovarius subalbicans]MCI2399840.1 signal peptidase II [Aliiroseovarius subalbicans]
MAWMTRIALLILVLDQTSKYAVVQLLNLKELGTLQVLPPYLNFHMAWNRGVNFGLFSGDSDATRWILIAIALAISAWVVSWVLRDGLGRLGQISAGLLVGGALGNVLDRLVYGAVADFLNMSCCGFENPFAFNVADIAIFAGAFGLILFTGGKKAP